MDDLILPITPDSILNALSTQSQHHVLAKILLSSSNNINYKYYISNLLSNLPLTTTPSQFLLHTLFPLIIQIEQDTQQPACLFKDQLITVFFKKVAPLLLLHPHDASAQQTTQQPSYDDPSQPTEEEQLATAAAAAGVPLLNHAFLASIHNPSTRLNTATAFFKAAARNPHATHISHVLQASIKSICAPTNVSHKQLLHYFNTIVQHHLTVLTHHSQSLPPRPRHLPTTPSHLLSQHHHLAKHYNAALIHHPTLQPQKNLFHSIIDNPTSTTHHLLKSLIASCIFTNSSNQLVLFLAGIPQFYSPKKLIPLFVLLIQTCDSSIATTDTLMHIILASIQKSQSPKFIHILAIQLKPLLLTTQSTRLNTFITSTLSLYSTTTN